MDVADEVSEAPFLSGGDVGTCAKRVAEGGHLQKAGVAPAAKRKTEAKKRKPRSHSVVTAANLRLQDGVHTPLKRHASDMVTAGTWQPDAKRKGLRHFAVRVCRKVEGKRSTTYNEVADELVQEERDLRGGGGGGGGSGGGSGSGGGGSGGANEGKAEGEDDGGLVDEKNIRRRVYDSLNVLMAMRIIRKERKEIRWQGLDAAEHARKMSQVDGLRAQVAAARRRVDGKREEAAEARDQVERQRALMRKRRAQHTSVDVDVGDVDVDGDGSGEGESGGVRAAGSMRQGVEGGKLRPPFVVVHAPCRAQIDLTMDETREEACFNFSDRFGLLDDREVLKRMPLLPVELALCKDERMT